MYRKSRRNRQRLHRRHGCRISRINQIQKTINPNLSHPSRRPHRNSNRLTMQHAMHRDQGPRVNRKRIGSISPRNRVMSFNLGELRQDPEEKEEHLHFRSQKQRRHRDRKSMQHLHSHPSRTSKRKKQHHHDRRLPLRSGQTAHPNQSGDHPRIR